MTRGTITPAHQALHDFVDQHGTSLHQALLMARDSNLADADRLEAAPDEPGFPGPTHAVARLMRESAASWNRLADELTAITDAFPGPPHFEED